MTSTTELPQDAREQLYNERAVGPIHQVQLPAARITTLHGILIDLDPRLYRPGNPYFPPADNPRDFFAGIGPVLNRHPLASRAEVRLSGTGLHLIVWLDPPAQLHTAVEQQRWDHLVRAVQYSLPGDPNAPGITAVTRPVGSVNTKNGAVVEVLRLGEPVTPDKVEEFVAGLTEAPFRQVASVLLGSSRVSPCPVCRREGSRLDVLEHHGHCYGHCGRVTLDQLLDQLYAPCEAVSGGPGLDVGGRASSGARKVRGRIGTRSAATPETQRE